MKTNKTKRLRVLSSCLILAATLGMFACQSSGNDTTQKKTDENSDFMVSKFDNHTLLVGASVKAKVALPANAKPNGAVHIDISSSDATILDSDKKSCDLTAQAPSCEVSLTAKNVGTAYAKFKSGTTEHSSETLSVVAESILSIGGLDQPAIMLDAAPITANVSFPNGTSLDKDVSVDITSEPADAVTITGSPCSLSNTNLSCDFNIKGNKVVDKVIISAKANNGKTATKEIKVINKPTLYIRGLTDVTATQSTHAMIGVVGPANNLKVSVSSSKSDVATVALSSPDCTVSPNPKAEAITADDSTNVAYECEITITTKTKGSTDIIATASNVATATQTLNVLPIAIKNLTLGLTHSCLVDTTNAVHCWGYHTAGVIGDGIPDEKDPILTPSLTVPNTTVKFLSAGNNFNIAIDNQDKLIGWGTNKYGALNQPSAEIFASPASIAFPGSISAIATLADGACAINTADSKIYCWGSNAHGQLGIGSIDSDANHAPAPIKSTQKFASLSTNAGYTVCGITAQDGKLLCWGQNRFGEVGIADHKDVINPTEISKPANVTKFIKASAGEYHSCAISDKNDAYCWGDNKYGQLGTGSNDQSDTPKPVAGNIKFQELVATGALTCGIDLSGKVYCWGRISTGSLGDGKTPASTTPVLASLPQNFVTAKISIYTTEWDNQMTNICAVSTKGQAYCWGRNGGGQLGDGTRESQASPTLVKFNQ